MAVLELAFDVFDRTTLGNIIFFIQDFYLAKLIYLSIGILSSICHTNSYGTLGLPVVHDEIVKSEKILLNLY